MLRVHPLHIAAVVLGWISMSGVSQAQPPREVGLYQSSGPHQRVVLSPRQMGERRILILTDLGTGAIRALFPAGENGLVAGETLLSPEPAAYRLARTGPDDGPVEQLEIEDLATGARWTATRVPLRSEEVEIDRDGLVLRGTLHLPPDRGPHPAVVLIGGSEGEADRHSLDALPYVLADEGFTVLAFDKRGTGSSGGSWDVDHPTLAADVVAWTEWLSAHDEVSDWVGYFGFSEGAWIAPMAASRTTGVDFIVAVAGGALPKSRSFLHQSKMRLLEEGLTGDSLETTLTEKRAEMASSHARASEGDGASAFDLRMAHDPTTDWQAFSGPILFLIGEDDVLVPPHASADRMRTVLAESHHPDYTIRVFPRATHPLFQSVTGTPSEFFQMQGLSQFVPGYWETLLWWLDRRRLES